MYRLNEYTRAGEKAAVEGAAAGDGCEPERRGATAGFRVRPTMQVLPL